MTYDKDLAPFGWYVGSYLLRFVEIGDPTNESDDVRFLSWENTVLVKAASLAEAYDKVVIVGMGAAEPYKGGPEGIDVQWVFEGVTNLLPVYEELADGCEIMWAQHKPRMLKNLRRLVLHKQHFVK
jgi:hypothetical protein